MTKTRADFPSGKPLWVNCDGVWWPAIAQSVEDVGELELPQDVIEDQSSIIVGFLGEAASVMVVSADEVELFDPNDTTKNNHPDIQESFKILNDMINASVVMDKEQGEQETDQAQRKRRKVEGKGGEDTQHSEEEDGLLTEDDKAEKKRKKKEEKEERKAAKAERKAEKKAKKAAKDDKEKEKEKKEKKHKKKKSGASRDKELDAEASGASDGASDDDEFNVENAYKEAGRSAGIQRSGNDDEAEVRRVYNEESGAAPVQRLATLRQGDQQQQQSSDDTQAIMDLMSSAKGLLRDVLMAARKVYREMAADAVLLHRILSMSEYTFIYNISVVAAQKLGFADFLKTQLSTTDSDKERKSLVKEINRLKDEAGNVDELVRLQNVRKEEYPSHRIPKVFQSTFTFEDPLCRIDMAPPLQFLPYDDDEEDGQSEDMAQQNLTGRSDVTRSGLRPVRIMQQWIAQRDLPVTASFDVDVQHIRPQGRLANMHDETTSRMKRMSHHKLQRMQAGSTGVFFPTAGGASSAAMLNVADTMLASTTLSSVVPVDVDAQPFCVPGQRYPSLFEFHDFHVEPVYDINHRQRTDQQQPGSDDIVVGGMDYQRSTQEDEEVPQMDFTPLPVNSDVFAQSLHHQDDNDFSSEDDNEREGEHRGQGATERRKQRQRTRSFNASIPIASLSSHWNASSVAGDDTSTAHSSDFMSQDSMGSAVDDDGTVGRRSSGQRLSGGSRTIPTAGNKDVLVDLIRQAGTHTLKKADSLSLFTTAEFAAMIKTVRKRIVGALAQQHTLAGVRSSTLSPQDERRVISSAAHFFERKLREKEATTTNNIERASVHSSQKRSREPVADRYDF